MFTRYSTLATCVIAITFGMLASCGTVRDQGIEVSKNHDIRRPVSLGKLEALPKPANKISVAVYRFPDLTGAFKPNDGFAVYSKAVSQGADAMVIDALLKAGQGQWFDVVERQGLKALFQERKILEYNAENYRKKQQMTQNVIADVLKDLNKKKPKPQPRVQKELAVNPNNRFAATGSGAPTFRIINPSASGFKAPGELRSADYMIEGGIIGYDSDIETSGAGAKFFNIGGFGEIRKDVVTISMRLINVRTGQVVLNTTLTKGVYSQKLQGSGFGYIEVDRFLEAEAGVGYNEPVYEAVNLAVQAGVYDLIQKGLQSGIWQMPRPQTAAASIKPPVQNQRVVQPTPHATNAPVIQKSVPVQPVSSIKPAPAPKFMTTHKPQVRPSGHTVRTNTKTDHNKNVPASMMQPAYTAPARVAPATPIKQGTQMHPVL